MASNPPDRACTDDDSPYHVNTKETPIGIRFNGVEQKDVVEYCISEGWIQCQKRNWKGQPIGTAGKWTRGPVLHGTVEAYYKKPRDWSAEI